MTQTANVSFETQKVDAPAGVGALGGYAVSLFLAGVLVGAAVTVADKTVPAQFVITDPGTYTVQVTRLTAVGDAVLSPVSSAPFDIVAEQVDAPLTVTVTLAPSA